MTKKAYCLLREDPHYRAHAFRQGLANAGYQVRNAWPSSAQPDDLLVIWNRYEDYDRIATHFERCGGKVLVAENGYLGNDFSGDKWFALAVGGHGGSGSWPSGGAERWDSFGVELKPWQSGGDEILILPQRGIGQIGVTMPLGWGDKTRNELRFKTARNVRIREHPGKKNSGPTLEEDLSKAWACVTWGSGAALKALMHGVPVFYAYEKWIGASAALPLSDDLENRFTGDRLPMFRKLAWAMWNCSEIISGEPFRLCAEI